MITRLLMGALVFLAAACTTAATPAPEPAQAAWACRDVVRDAAVHAYAMARYRDDQRAVIILPAGKEMAAYEGETKRLRSEGARLIGALRANDPQADSLPPPRQIAMPALSDGMVAAKIEAADACVAGAGK